MRRTKEDLIQAVYLRTTVTYESARSAVDAVFTTIAKALAGGGEVSIKGFGRFQVKERPARTGRNPRTGEAVEITSRRVVRFQPSATLKRAVN